jgi:hypothetical protein
MRVVAELLRRHLAIGLSKSNVTRLAEDEAEYLIPSVLSETYA